MPSNEVFDGLQRAGIDLLSDEGALFNKYDSLATSEDISELYSVLSSVRDKTDRPAVITPVAVVANPDFKRISESRFTKYFFEPVNDTLARFKGCETSFSLWQEGVKKRLFVPQFHGREHLNVRVWMNALQKGNKRATEGFKFGFWGMSTQKDPGIGVEFQAAFDFIDKADLTYQREVIISGLELFSNLFGYRASYFAPPNGPLNPDLEIPLAEMGIRYLSMPRIQTVPLGGGKTRKRFHWLGHQTASGLTVITRNCFFEPVVPGTDWVDRCLSDISIAFRWNKPAIISSHRVNYTGRLSVDNRKNGLRQLNRLLKTIVRKWPEAEFITSDELGNIISHD